ncbi:putative monovalent cation/H+ antiporter subunit A [Chitinophaga silvatica]|uniref:Putative monovalent cation/H+ antiporter subunit A n=1 Tax=Chitinophaga silvatica TaxID=2282649 RepID=A0A3E1YAG8_9BACT|nr:putative monovalent cation/H+ antiporter subunit A [Chitinophaga silvatica]RFS22713.1 putative monovalent cation/H+ antiporter subunit A [Chitinophaga silvatica]
MLIVVLSGFLFAFLTLLSGKLVRNSLSWFPALLPLALFIYFMSYIPVVAAGPVRFHYPWVTSMGVDLDFKLDGLAMLFSLLITGIGTCIFVYASYYLKGNKYLDRFFCYLSIFMAAMLGMVLADNLIILFIFWELTSISSYFLIGFNNEEKKSRRNALMALTITGAGGFLLMAGFILIGSISGTYSINSLIASGGSLQQHALYGWMILFIFAGAFTKSAQFPFHFWLPGAMVAPTPVSAYLHSATMVKAGIYLLARFTPILGHTTSWSTTLIIVGGITMLYSAFHSLQRIDLKEILAYSTIAALGTLVFLLGIGTSNALLAAAVFILVHALYKAALFMVAGILDHETGTRNIGMLRGLKKVMWPVALAGMLAAFSSAGIPLTFGFIGKELIYESTFHAPYIAVILTLIALFTNILILYAGFQAGIRPFTGKLSGVHQHLHIPSFRLWLPPLLLALLGVVLGIWPSLVDGPLIRPVYTALGETTILSPLLLWHGFNWVVVLSIVTIIAGCLLYYLFVPSRSYIPLTDKWLHLSPEALTVRLGRAFIHFSNRYTNLFHNGFLRSYVSVIIVFITCLLAMKLITGVDVHFDIKTNISDIRSYDIVIFLIIIAAIWKSISTSSRINAVASLSVVGYCICLLFVIYSAPDLAMTQFTIDTLTVVLFVLVLFRLPPFLKINDRRVILRDSVIATAFGLLIAIIALEVMNEPTTKDISKFYSENAYLLAKGKNVVNVMLVDFRGFDTLVEITVLTIAALGVYSLMKLRVSSTTKE